MLQKIEIDSETVAFAKQVLFDKYGIDIRAMGRDGIKHIRSILPKLSALMDLDREIVDKLLALAQQQDLMTEIASIDGE